MCGIAGWAGPGPEISLNAALNSLSHRGPDEQGGWVGGSVALGIARLSIIDVKSGHQPVFSSDESVVAVLNGEIYNYRELAQKLRSQGVHLRSGSDAEVIPHLYQELGTGFAQKLRGMFAIALWDRRNERLLLVRDRVGKKPLLYAQEGQRLLFASEARAILAAGWRSAVDLAAIDHVLAFDHVPVDGSAFVGLKMVPPGHMLEFHQGRITLQRYWDWTPHQSKMSLQGLGTRVENALDEAVRIRLVSERPLGSFLSGGIDSTIVTALMARHHSGPVKTFSVGFKDPVYDESNYARSVADYLGTDHTELVVEPDPESLLSRLAEAYDQPFADSSSVPSLLLSDMASRDVVVALAGDGGDEVFGGYVRYWAAPAIHRLGPLLAVGEPASASLMALGRRLARPRLGRLARALRPQPSLGDRYLQMMTWTPRPLRDLLWTAEARVALTQPTPEQRFLDLWQSLEGLSDLDRLRAHDMAMYLPGDLLTKVDIASMACSLEVRSPFLDQEVLALAAGLPRQALIRGRTTKWILREFAYRLVPRELVDRPKMGFGIPRGAWLRGPLREMTRDLLTDRTARERGWFDTALIERLLTSHDRGMDQDQYLWPLLVVELWARRWADSFPKSGDLVAA